MDRALFYRWIQSGLPTLLLCLAYGLVMLPLAPGFATPENACNVLVAMLPLLIVATGQTIVLISAGIDLSVTSTIALTSVVGASILTAEGSPLAGSVAVVPIAVLAMIAVGCMVGFTNGTLVAWLRMPPFIVTLTSMMFFQGLAVWWTQSESIYNLPSSFLLLGKNPWISFAIALFVAAAAHILLTHTLFGVSLRSVGHNVDTAHVSGINVPRTLIRSYVLCGACAAIASILITGQLETGSPVQWDNNLLDVIGATVIGGTSLYGGRGSVLWTVSGVLLLTLIDNSLNLLNLSYFTIMMAKGGVILLAALFDTLRCRIGGQEGA